MRKSDIIGKINVRKSDIIGKDKCEKIRCPHPPCHVHPFYPLHPRHLQVTSIRILFISWIIGQHTTIGIRILVISWSHVLISYRSKVQFAFYWGAVEDSETSDSNPWPQYQLGGEGFNQILNKMELMEQHHLHQQHSTSLNQMAGGTPGAQHYPPQVPVKKSKI